MRLLILALCAVAHGADWVPDFDRDDHRKHAIGGALISAGTGLAVEALWPEMKPWKKHAIALGAGLAVGIAKEIIDSRSSDHTAEASDAVATGVGAVIGTAGASLVFRWTF